MMQRRIDLFVDYSNLPNESLRNVHAILASVDPAVSSAFYTSHKVIRRGSLTSRVTSNKRKDPFPQAAITWFLPSAPCPPSTKDVELKVKE